MVVIAILVWKRKFKNKVSINSAGVPTTSPIEMDGVDSSSQLKTVDTESSLKKFEEAEEKEVDTDLDNPNFN